MLEQIATLLSRPRKTLIADALGTAALFGTLVLALHLPLT